MKLHPIDLSRLACLSLGAMTTVLLLASAGKAHEDTQLRAWPEAGMRALRQRVAAADFLQKEIEQGYAAKDFKRACQAIEDRTFIAREMMTLLKVFPYKDEVLPVDQPLAKDFLNLVESAWEDDVKALKACRKVGLI